jgi:predicted PurR-regulated permease PerM
MAVFALGHPCAVLALVLVLALAFFLYVLKPEPLNLCGLEVGKRAKHVIVAIGSFLALTVGHVFELLVSLAFFLAVVVGIHSAIREHTA